jgi:hypothetical protein
LDLIVLVSLACSVVILMAPKRPKALVERGGGAGASDPLERP